ncbi:12087_t:CDS:1, partial [Dentiscutata heterogama]
SDGETGVAQGTLDAAIEFVKNNPDRIIISGFCRSDRRNDDGLIHKKYSFLKTECDDNYCAICDDKYCAIEQNIKISEATLIILLENN